MGTKARLLSVGKGNEREQVLEWGREMDTRGDAQNWQSTPNKRGKKV